MRIDLHRDPGRRRGRAPGRPGPGPRRRRRPAAGRRRHRDRWSTGTSCWPCSPSTWPSAGQLAGNTVVVTVMTNLGFRLAMEERGIIVKETPVGDRYVLAALDEDGLRPRRRAVRAHRLPAAGHHRRRPADRAGPGRPGGPDGQAAGRAVWTAWSPGCPRCWSTCPCPTPSCWTAPRPCGRRWPRRRSGWATTGRVLLRPSGTEPLVRVMVEATGDGVAEEIAQRLEHPGRVRAAGGGGHARADRDRRRTRRPGVVRRR